MNQYLQKVKNIKPASIMVVGDIMLDMFVHGKVRRISPEAPVPVVEVTKETNMPGGAGNVALNISSLTSKAVLIGVLGVDNHADLLLSKYSTENVDFSSVIKTTERNTIVKTRIIAEHQQVVRVDREDKHVFSSHLINEIKKNIAEKIDSVKIVVISDYGKGLINDEILGYLIPLAVSKNIPVLVDPKIEHFKKYKNITCMTPNFLEARQGMDRMNVGTLEEIENLGKDILKELNSTSVLITRSEEGMSLFEKDTITHIPTMAKEVYDVTGAGDTVISTLAVCLGNGLSLKDSAYISNYAAGIVVGKLGTATTTIEEIVNYLDEMS
jgi:D-beta-D-heptose 7-phosphate kinase/D-beta-D-heptose 1-phosphate adenosyltransferase